jgi:hypothetical protein
MQGEKEEIGKKISAMLAKLSAADRLLKGSVSKVVLGKKKRGKGKRESLLLTYKVAGNRTRTVYVGRERLSEVKEMIAAYRQARKALEQIVELNVRLFKMK